MRVKDRLASGRVSLPEQDAKERASQFTEVNLGAARLQRMELGEPDASGRRPVPVPGSEFELPCQIVVVALGTTANPLPTQTAPALKLNTRQNIVVDKRRATAMEGVFAGGDIVRGGATVILAMGDGKEAARSIDAYLKPRIPKRKA